MTSRTASTILAIESSCDETAVAILRGGDLLANEIASQIALHRPYGGIVPEVASRNHNLALAPLLEAALQKAGVSLSEVDAFAATAGPGLASSLLIGTTAAKTLALALQKPFLSVNHLEGHLLSPFLGQPGGVRPCISLIVSGGHTILLHLRAAGDHTILGRTRDDAAGEAFDKVAKMLGLPYPGGPEIDACARSGDPAAYQFPRSMKNSGDYAFSFSGLKTAMRYTLEKIETPLSKTLIADLAASFQEAVVEVLVFKAIRAAEELGETLIGLSGGVSCNSRLREAFARETEARGLELAIAPPHLCTDNAAMIAHAAAERFRRGEHSSLEEDIDPNLSLV
jgi:N6-L-threonylcarbamoyladenine synthase